MQHRTLTDADIKAYRGLFQTYSLKEGTSFSAYSIAGRIKEDGNTSCYASWPQLLSANEDQGGVLYNGFHIPINGNPWASLDRVPKFTQHMPKAYGSGAREWLTFLLDDKGPFKDVLPFLKFISPDEILRDKGFIFHDLCNGANMSLVFCFISVSRIPSECPRVLFHWNYLRTAGKCTPTEAAFIAITMAPVTYTLPCTDKWELNHLGHGNTFGGGVEKVSHVERFVYAEPDLTVGAQSFSMSGCQKVFAGQKRLPSSGMLSELLKVIRGLKETKNEALPAAA